MKGRFSWCRRALGGLLVVLTVQGQAFGVAPAEAQSTSPEQAVLRVGPAKAIRTLAEAAKQAHDGDTVEVDGGDYVGDVAVWRQNRLTIRAVGGRVRLIASGANAEGKGIWVIRGGNVTVQGFDFIGARVPDRNGAGIRLDKGQLVVIDCRFLDNENGILTANHHEITLKIEDSEFGHNGAGDGQSHNLYAGGIGRLEVSGSHFHHARSGHLFKSRARENFVFYNRLVDGESGQASYELEFPNGGFAYVVGNVIEQSATTENFHVISFGAEGLRWPNNALYLANNTIVDLRSPPGVLLKVQSGADIFAANNLLVGRGSLEAAGPGTYSDNFLTDARAFVDMRAGDYRLKAKHPLVGKANPQAQANGTDLHPRREFVAPRGTRPVPEKSPFNPGGMQSLGTP